MPPGTGGLPPLPRPSVRELHQVMDEALTARQIAVPLEPCDGAEDAEEVRRRLEGKHFDVTGLRENGVVTGYVLRAALGKGPCRAFRRPFGPRELVASTTPLVRCLPLLIGRAWVFVLEHDEVNALVTRADLQKPPVRMLLFALCSLLEAHLLEMVRICYRPEALEAAPGLDEARKLLRSRLRRNEDIDLADCLSLGEKHELLLCVPGLTAHLGLGPPREAERYFKDVEDVRNRLAHGQDLVKGSSWERLIGTVLRVEGFLVRCEEGGDEFRKKFGGPAVT